MNKIVVMVVVGFTVAAMVVGGCSKPASPPTGAVPPPTDLGSLLQVHRGQVLVLLLGIEGCPGTAKATEALDDYVPGKPEKVAVIRLDVPLPGKKFRPSGEWKHKFPRMIDDGRKIAGELEFFYYPTLYIYDREGVQRYVGGCDKDKVAAIASEILTEKPGAKKELFTLPMPKVGESAPAFSGTLIGGKSVSRKSLAKGHGLLIVFSRTSCPFSVKAMPEVKATAGQFGGKGIGVVVVNQQQELSEIKPVYEEQCAGVPVVWDKSGAICKAYGVDAVPFFFLLDKDGKVVARRSFTHPAAVNSINSLLGLKTEKPRYKPTEGG